MMTAPAAASVPMMETRESVQGLCRLAWDQAQTKAHGNTLLKRLLPGSVSRSRTWLVRCPLYWLGRHDHE